MYYTNPSFPGNLPVFLITSNNIVFIGDGPDRTHIEGYSLGMKNPVTNWYSPYPGGPVCRFNMFQAYALTGTDISTVQFRSLDVCGNAGYTSTGCGQSINDTTGDGWDITNKCICMLSPGLLNNLLVFNCRLHDFRGEILYCGSNEPEPMSIINCDIYGSNGDGVSVSANTLLYGDAFGGDFPGCGECNGVENFDMGAPERPSSRIAPSPAAAAASRIKDWPPPP